MSASRQQGLPPVNAIPRYGKKEVPRIQVLIDEMHASLLRSPAFPLTALHEARKLEPELVSQSKCWMRTREKRGRGVTYSVFAFLPLQREEGVVAFLDVQVEQVG